MAEGTGGGTDDGAEGEHGGGFGNVRKRRVIGDGASILLGRTGGIKTGRNIDVLAPKVLAVIAKVGRRFCIADRPAETCTVIGGTQLQVQQNIRRISVWLLEIIS